MFYGISYNEGKRLLEVYDSEVNCMYPMFHEGGLVEKYAGFWEKVDKKGLSRKTKHHQQKTQSVLDISNNNEDDENKNLSIVMLALANAAVLTNSCLGPGKTMFDKASDKIMQEAFKEPASLPILICLLLIHQYQFHCDMGTVPYRTIGFAGIMALELGMHSYNDLESSTDLTRIQKEYHRLVFWCLYVMDRRQAVYTKNPCILPEDEIDQKMPNYYVFTIDPYASENDLYRAMHLNYMIYYSQIAGKFCSGSHDQQTIERFETMLNNWQASLPPELKLTEKSINQEPQSSTKLKSILYLKSNLMLLHIYSSNRLSSYPPQAVNAARQCIRELARLYFNTELYVSCEIQYNHILVASLEVLYSAICAEPQKYSKLCSEDLSLALKLINLIVKRPESEQHHRGSIWKLISSFAQRLRSTAEATATTTTNNYVSELSNDTKLQQPLPPEVTKDEILEFLNQLYGNSTTSSPPDEENFNTDVHATSTFFELESTNEPILTAFGSMINPDSV